MQHAHRNRALVWALALLLLLAAQAGAPAQPGHAAPAEGITPIFLGSLASSDTHASTAADRFFSTLAQQAQTSIDIALYDFDRVSVRDALLAAKARGVNVRVVGDD